MSTGDAARVADLLDEIGRRVQLEIGNPYKALAYLRAAESLRHLARPLQEIIDQGGLKDLPAIGEAIARRIVALQQGEADPWLEKSRAKFPAGLLELLSIPGLKPEGVLRLFRTVGISSLDELEQACRNGDLNGIKGFTSALQRRLLGGIDMVRAGRGLLRINRAHEILAHGIAEVKRNRPDLANITIAGDLRRGCELISDLSLVASGKVTGETTIERLGAITLHIAPREEFATALLFATGSRQHTNELQKLARHNGLNLTPAGLHQGVLRLPTPTEADAYKALGLPFISPELREGSGEVELAAKGRLPTLVKEEDLNGLLHVHTDYSDGLHSLEEMAEGARRRGYHYLGVCDHSQSAHYARGLDLDAVVAQLSEIDVLNRRWGRGFRILKGIESDIRIDGSLDYDDDILACFDFVVASVHGRFRLDRKAQTARIISAIQNPFTTILGHPTGRLLLRRPEYEVDVDTILKACAQNGVAIEINCNPNRLDLDWRWHRLALELGCCMSINPDAHSTRELDLIKWGVSIARKGGVPRERVLNAMRLEQMLAYLRNRRQRAQKKTRTASKLL